MTTRFVKKLGDPHPETIQVELTEAQRGERRKQACDLRGMQKATLEEAKLKAAEYRQKKKSLENLEDIARGEADTGMSSVAVIVQDYLTTANEVVSVRLDTQEMVSRRTATGEELQEELFGGDDEDETSGKPS